jgi:hypothetical protein
MTSIGHNDKATLHFVKNILKFVALLLFLSNPCLLHLQNVDWRRPNLKKSNRIRFLWIILQSMSHIFDNITGGAFTVLAAAAAFFPLNAALYVNSYFSASV